MVNKKYIIIPISIIYMILTMIGANWLHNYDVDKCLSIQGNDYYEAKNNCYTTLEQPVVNKILAIIVVGITLIGFFVFITFILFEIL